MDYQPGQPTEEEVAAGLAAVLAFMEADEVEKAKSNSWKQANYLESTFGTSGITARQAKVKGSLWNIASRLARLALIFGLSVMPAWSQELRPPLPEPNSGNAPMPAPQFSQFQAQPQAQLLRVGLLIGADKLDLNTPDGADIIDQATGEVVGSSGASQKLVVASKRGTLSLAVVDATTASALKPVSYTPNTTPQGIDKGWHGVLLGLAGQSGYVVAPRSADGLVGVNGKLYRGQLLLSPNRNSRDKLNVINLVDLEDYLLSVLPSEMPSLWHPEALKAQAIAARSY
ncbi:MAG: SpoIID/LytB domain-containing protein, partial [Candidatus Obscuribacterales bacterium]|nr:SpoIID/LytB domain-containing protein [Candidatus Obscuribacterales bacterium]